MSVSIPDWLMHLLERPVAVFGAGVSGRAAAGLIGHVGGEAVVYDRAATVETTRHFGAGEARRHGLVVVSPGFAPTHDWVRAARSAGCEVLGEVDLGALTWPGEIVAITGTNGKTTLAGFLAHALKLAGRDARTVGNMGDAFSDAWRVPASADAIAVCEVSSFQAETVRFLAPSATLWSNFAEDHLERHGSLAAYFNAKYNLVKHTRRDAVFHGPSVFEQARALGLELPVTGCVPYGVEATDPRLVGTAFEHPPQRENYLLARAWWRHAGHEEEHLLAAAQSFRTGPHRLACVGTVRGVSFWNDSKATNFHATEAALARFDRPPLWIGGGRAKGGDLAGFATRVAPRVRQAFLIGETREALGRHLRDQAVPVAVCASLRDAVARAFQGAARGDYVLLSPGFASFDMFDGYDDRGRRFEAIVAELGADASGPSNVQGLFLSPTPPNPTPTRPAAAGLCLL